TVHVKPAGGFWARLDTLQVNPLVPDAELKRALPPGLRNALEAVGLRQPVGLDTVLVLDQPAAAGVPPVVYWDRSLWLRNAALQAGVDSRNVTGQLSCQGLHNGQQLEDVVGNLYLEEATVLGQPLRKVHVPLAVWKNSPDILRLPGMKAQLFGGALAAEAPAESGPTSPSAARL